MEEGVEGEGATRGRIDRPGSVFTDRLRDGIIMSVAAAVVARSVRRQWKAMGKVGPRSWRGGWLTFNHHGNAGRLLSRKQKVIAKARTPGISRSSRPPDYGPRTACAYPFAAAIVRRSARKHCS